MPDSLADAHQCCLHQQSRPLVFSGNESVSTPPRSHSILGSQSSTSCFAQCLDRFPLPKAFRARMITCCCCWPVHKCVTALSCLDTLIVAYVTYKFGNTLFSTFYEPEWFSVAAFLFFFAFLVCQVLGTVFIIQAHKKNNRRYCYPRLTLLLGLTIIALIACLIVLIYFFGAHTSMNNFFLKAYEWFFGAVNDKERAEILGELKLYAFAFLLLTLTFFLYSVFELLLTRKFYQSLAHFERVPQNEATAPHQPPFNPDYKH
ncbi:unnamed protein product [Auanema sp. JU1783]|nr:unnamed protein product [Auanema sp. JU1783]